mgnify:CR=1 FL=1
MSEKIVQLNEEIIKGQLKESVTQFRFAERSHFFSTKETSGSSKQSLQIKSQAPKRT